MPSIRSLTLHGRRSARLGLVLAGIASSLALAKSARAEETSCTELHATGQRERKAGHLKLAAQQFMACGSDEACAEVVRSDCMEMYMAVDRALPTVIFSVVDQSGADVTGVVKVYSGDEVIVEGLDGRALPVDPGHHQFRFILPWGETATTVSLIRESEKNRVVSIKVYDPSKAAEASAPASSPGTPTGTPTSPGGMDVGTEPEVKPNRTPLGFWVATGVGVAALGTGTVFELLGRKRHASLADCSPFCDEKRRNEYTKAQRYYLIGDVALGAGIVALGTAAVLYFTSGKLHAEQAGPRATSLRLTPIATGHSAGLVLSGAGL